MNLFILWFVKLTGVLPFLIKNRPVYYFKDKTIQSRVIKGSAIIMPNHYSLWDFATIMHAFWKRNIHCVVAKVMFDKGKLFSWFLRKLGCIKVDRKDVDFDFINRSCEILKKNGVVEIYPESRLPLKGEETPLPFKPSVTYLALHTDVPIIPVVSNRGYKGKDRLRVLIGTPIYVSEFYDDSLTEKENIVLITTKLHDIIKELNDELKEKTK